MIDINKFISEHITFRPESFFNKDLVKNHDRLLNEIKANQFW